MAEDDDFDDLDLPVEPEGRPRMPGSDVEQMLRRLHEMVASARPMPLSTSVMVNRDELLDLLDETIERLPDELRAARWLLKEREEYLAKVKREGEDILDQARTRAERMVQRTEVVKASEARARKIVDAATDEAARLKNEVEDFCDQKLASFEIVLERTQTLVAAGRDKLQGTNLLAEAAAAAAAEGPLADGDVDDDMTSGHPSGGGTYAEAAAAYDDPYADPESDDDYDPDDGDEYDDQVQRNGQGRLKVVADDRVPRPDLPPPPSQNETIRDAAATFFDQDLA